MLWAVTASVCCQRAKEEEEKSHPQRADYHLESLCVKRHQKYVLMNIKAQTTARHCAQVQRRRGISWHKFY